MSENTYEPWKHDYIKMDSGKPSPTDDLSEKLKTTYAELKKISDESGVEILTVGIKEGKPVLLNQRGEIAKTKTYQQHVEDCRKEFVDLVYRCHNK